MIFKLISAIILALLILFFGHYYIYHRVFYTIFGYSNPLLLSIYFILFGLSFFGFLIIRILPQFMRKFIELIMFSWMGIAFILLVLCGLTIPVQIFFNIMGYNQKYLSYFILFFGFFLVLHSIYQAMRKPKIINTTIPVPIEVLENVENLKIVVLSDIHVSGLIGKRKMKNLAYRVNKLNPDIIFLTGDLMDGSVKQLKKEIFPLKSLSAKHGVTYITGNHEYYSGPVNWKNHFQNVFGWKVLSNSCQILNLEGITLNILGIEDKHWLTYERTKGKKDKRLESSIEKLMEERRTQSHSLPIENCLNILLAHQPKDAKHLPMHPWIHLQISGHTHGGQIWPLKYIVYLDQKFNSGLYKINNSQYIYVNQGTGFWGPPMRLGTCGEISVLNFKRQQ